MDDMTSSSRFARVFLATVLATTLVCMSVAPAFSMVRSEPDAYWSLERQSASPFAPFTEPDQATSTIPYYSTINGPPYAPYTELDTLQTTSVIAYFSVVRDQ